LFPGSDTNASAYLGQRCAVITDRNVPAATGGGDAVAHHSGFEPLLITVPAGETARA